MESTRKLCVEECVTANWQFRQVQISASTASQAPSQHVWERQGAVEAATNGAFLCSIAPSVPVDRCLLWTIPAGANNSLQLTEHANSQLDDCNVQLIFPQPLFPQVGFAVRDGSVVLAVISQTGELYLIAVPVPASSRGTRSFLSGVNATNCTCINLGAELAEAEGLAGLAACPDAIALVGKSGALLCIPYTLPLPVDAPPRIHILRDNNVVGKLLEQFRDDPLSRQPTALSPLAAGSADPRLANLVGLLYGNCKAQIWDVRHRKCLGTIRMRPDKQMPVPAAVKVTASRLRMAASADGVVWLVAELQRVDGVWDQSFITVARAQLSLQREHASLSQQQPSAFVAGLQPFEAEGHTGSLMDCALWSGSLWLLMSRYGRGKLYALDQAAGGGEGLQAGVTAAQQAVLVEHELQRTFPQPSDVPSEQERACAFVRARLGRGQEASLLGAPRPFCRYLEQRLVLPGRLCRSALQQALALLGLQVGMDVILEASVGELVQYVHQVVQLIAARETQDRVLHPFQVFLNSYHELWLQQHQALSLICNPGRQLLCTARAGPMLGLLRPASAMEAVYHAVHPAAPCSPVSRSAPADARPPSSPSGSPDSIPGDLGPAPRRLAAILQAVVPPIDGLACDGFTSVVACGEHVSAAQTVYARLLLDGPSPPSTISAGVDSGRSIGATEQEQRRSWRRARRKSLLRLHALHQSGGLVNAVRAALVELKQAAAASAAARQPAAADASWTPLSRSSLRAAEVAQRSVGCMLLLAAMRRRAEAHAAVLRDVLLLLRLLQELQLVADAQQLRELLQLERECVADWQSAALCGWLAAEPCLWQTALGSAASLQPEARLAHLDINPQTRTLALDAPAAAHLLPQLLPGFGPGEPGTSLSAGLQTGPGRAAAGSFAEAFFFSGCFGEAPQPRPAWLKPAEGAVAGVFGILPEDAASWLAPSGQAAAAQTEPPPSYAVPAEHALAQLSLLVCQCLYQQRELACLQTLFCFSSDSTTAAAPSRLGGEAAAVPAPCLPGGVRRFLRAMAQLALYNRASQQGADMPAAAGPCDSTAAAWTASATASRASKERLDALVNGAVSDIVIGSASFRPEVKRFLSGLAQRLLGEGLQTELARLQLPAAVAAHDARLWYLLVAMAAMDELGCELGAMQVALVAVQEVHRMRAAMPPSGPAAQQAQQGPGQAISSGIDEAAAQQQQQQRQLESIESTLWNSAFKYACDCHAWHTAYVALVARPQQVHLSRLIVAMCSAKAFTDLASLPFCSTHATPDAGPSLPAEAKVGSVLLWDEVVQELRCRAQHGHAEGQPVLHHVLYDMFVMRSSFREAAGAMLAYARALQPAADLPGGGGQRMLLPEALKAGRNGSGSAPVLAALSAALAAAVNALQLVPLADRWLEDPAHPLAPVGLSQVEVPHVKPQGNAVTLSDLQKELAVARAKQVLPGEDAELLAMDARSTLLSLTSHRLYPEAIHLAATVYRGGELRQHLQDVISSLAGYCMMLQLQESRLTPPGAAPALELELELPARADSGKRPAPLPRMRARRKPENAREAWAALRYWVSVLDADAWWLSRCPGQLPAHGQRMRCAAAGRILSSSQEMQLPAWLVATFRGSGAPALLQLYMQHNRLEDAYVLALEELDALTQQVNTAALQGCSAAVWQPHGLILQLSAMLDDPASHHLLRKVEAHAGHMSKFSSRMEAPMG